MKKHVSTTTPSKARNVAQSKYETAVNALKRFCEEHTDLTVLILDDAYPFRVQFIPNGQMSLFENENIDENGEVPDLTVMVGISTTVKSTLKIKMDAKLLKKLIKHAETIGMIYYQAYREQEG